MSTSDSPTLVSRVVRLEEDVRRLNVALSSRPGPWLSTADAAVYLRYTGKQPLRSVYRFMARHRIVARHDGHRLLIARVDVDRAIEGRDGRS